MFLYMLDISKIYIVFQLSVFDFLFMPVSSLVFPDLRSNLGEFTIAL